MAKFNFDSVFQNNSDEDKKQKDIIIKPNINIKLVGEFKFDNDSEWYYGPKITIELPNNKKVEINLVLVDDFTKYENEIYESVEYLKNNTVSIFENAEKHIFEYYKNTEKMFHKELNFPIIKRENEVWENISIGNDAMINIRDDDKKIYISLECECSWEREHGLQIVIKEGKKINKIGQYDGHLTNSDAFAKKELENIVYYS